MVLLLISFSKGCTTLCISGKAFTKYRLADDAVETLETTILFERRRSMQLT
jgi:hypothetical protein